MQFNLHNNIDILAYLHLKYKFIPLTLMILLTKVAFHTLINILHMLLS